MATSIFKADRVGNLANLSTNAKTNLVAAINEVDGHADIVQAQVSNSGDAYSTSKAYAVGDLCIYNNVLYRCITACSAGSWTTNQSCFVQDTLVNLSNRLFLIGYAVSSEFYSGQIAGNSFSPEYLNLPAGKWIITTNGYAVGAVENIYAPIGLGENTGAVVKGFQPTWYLNTNETKKIYLWNIIGTAINVVGMCINAICVG